MATNRSKKILTSVSRNKSNILYGMSLALLLMLLRWLEFRFIVMSDAYEIYVGAIAVFFMALGIWLALKLASPKKETIVIEKEIITYQKEFVLDEAALKRTGISPRELEVLQMIAFGHTNKDIAEKLFVSANTVKTHLSKLFDKLEVARRTQAVEKAKRIGVIA